MTSFTLDLGPLAAPFARASQELEQKHFAEALWTRQLDVWTGDPATQQKIANRLGWLDIAATSASHVGRLQTFAESVRSEFDRVVLLGMGGSSLAPEVLCRILGTAAGFPAFRMLDSVDPDAVRAACADVDRTLFVLASKSGSTIEPNVMAAEAQRRLRESGVAEPGARFVAITDPDTLLEKRARDERFRDVFVNPPDIGGRYSALSFFGMVPAALMGADLGALLSGAREMAAASRNPVISANPGLALGAFMAAGARTGRDKLTLLLPSSLQSFGLWVEQLVAESTGKSGVGVVPIAGERPDAPLGPDRVAVAIALGTELPDAAQLEACRAAGLPLITLQMPDVNAIGAEFMRWEVATATAGLLLGINPFDEPNVQQAKDATAALLKVYEQQHRLSAPEPHSRTNGVAFTLSDAAQSVLAGAAPANFLRAIRPGDYFGLLAYLPPDQPAFAAPLDELRTAVGRRTGCATMAAFGPRYLHSTGQLHKGGANNGVFIVLTAAPAEDLPVPGQPFSFGVLEMAQAIGDFQSLDSTGRRALLINLPSRDPEVLRRVTALLLAG